MGWTFIGNTIVNRRGGGISWQTYWITQNIFDFFWFEGASNVTATELVDKSGNGNNVTITGKDFATAYIPATSAATFDCPNNATFIADDTDNLWINKNEESRGVEVSELIGYDFGRTIVWYDDASPHHIRAIGILKSTVTLTQAQIDKLHTDFHLALFWSGVENVNGFVKANRGLAQSVWTAVSEAALNYSDTYETAVLADGGEIISRKILESEYQRLIDTGDILSCWYAYHYKAGIKTSVINYGGTDYTVVDKAYNMSPVVGRFGVDVLGLYSAGVYDFRPEYTTSGFLFRNPNLNGLNRCGLMSSVASVLTNNNNRIRQRVIIIPKGESTILAKGTASDDGIITVQDYSTRLLLLGYRITGTTRFVSSSAAVFVDDVEVEIEIDALFTGLKTVIMKKDGDVIANSGFGAYTPIYPQQSYVDCVGCSRSSAREPFNGYIKQAELFTL